MPSVDFSVSECGGQVVGDSPHQAQNSVDLGALWHSSSHRVVVVVSPKAQQNQTY